MIDIKKTSETLHDLVLVNNDRVEGYEKAWSQTDDSFAELKELFKEFADESRYYAEELHEKIKVLGSEDGIESTTIPGKIYRVWMDIKFMFTGSDSKAILESCEFGEDAIQKAYNEALEERKYMDADTIRMIEWQCRSLKDSHDLIKEYRDKLRA